MLLMFGKELVFMYSCSSAGRDQDPDAVNSQNDAGYTALHHAAKHGSQGLIEILVKAGADRMLENNAGETPYMVAHKFQQWEAERLLLDVDQQHGVWANWAGVSKPHVVVLNVIHVHLSVCLYVRMYAYVVP